MTRNFRPALGLSFFVAVSSPIASAQDGTIFPENCIGQEQKYDDEGQQAKIFTALRDIQPGEEITVNYNGHEEDLTPVGFDVIDNFPDSLDSGRNVASRLGETVQIAGG